MSWATLTPSFLMVSLQHDPIETYSSDECGGFVVTMSLCSLRVLCQPSDHPPAEGDRCLLLPGHPVQSDRLPPGRVWPQAPRFENHTQIRICTHTDRYYYGFFRLLKVIPSFAFLWYLNQFSPVSQYYSVPQLSASATGPPSSSCHCSSSTKSTTAPSYTSRSPSASTWWRAPAEPLSWPRPPTCCATTPPRRRSRRWSCCPRWRTAARLSPPTMTLPISSNRRPPTRRRRRQTGLVKHPLLSLSLSARLDEQIPPSIKRIFPTILLITNTALHEARAQNSFCRQCLGAWRLSFGGG